MTQHAYGLLVTPFLERPSYHAGSLGRVLTRSLAQSGHYDTNRHGTRAKVGAGEKRGGPARRWQEMAATGGNATMVHDRLNPSTRTLPRRLRLAMTTFALLVLAGLLLNGCGGGATTATTTASKSRLDG